MEILQLRYFLVTAKYEHMTKAANALHIAQPALSQSISRLETELGTPLFDRQNRGIRLNAAGKLLEKRIMPILSTLDALPDELRKASGTPRQTLRLNLRAASHLVAQCIIEYKRFHPEISFQLFNNPDEDLFDLAIFSVVPGHHLPHSATIFEETFYLAVPTVSAYAQKAEIALSDVAQENFISLTNTRPLRLICDYFCVQAGFTPHIILESDNPDIVRSLIAAGEGVGFWPQYTWSAPFDDQITLLPIQPVCRRDILVDFHNHSSKKGIVMDFYRFLKQYVQTVSDSSEQE